MGKDGQLLGALLLVTGEPVDRRRGQYRFRQRPASRTCTDCGQTKPLDAFLPIKSTRTGYYGRCRVCRNERARQRYQSTPAIRAAEIDRAKRNNRRRAATKP